MSNDVECRVFGDQLDALVAGTLRGPAVAHMRAHAAGCPECAALLRVREHLAGPSLEALEDRVPEEVLAGFPDRVMEAVRAEGALAGSAAAAGSGARFVPWLAAAAVALLASTGFLAREVLRLQQREAVLALEVEARRAQVEGLQATGLPDAPPTSTPLAAGLRRGPFPGAIGRDGTVTAADLAELLRGLPGERVVLREAQVRALMRRPGALNQAGLRSLAGRISPEGDVTARDLLAALTGAGIDPDAEFDAGRLMDLLS